MWKPVPGSVVATSHEPSLGVERLSTTPALALLCMLLGIPLCADVTLGEHGLLLPLCVEIQRIGAVAVPNYRALAV